MAYVQWTDDVLVGIGQFDEHHRILYDLLNKVYAASMRYKQAALLKPVLDELGDYTRYHFDAEMELMRAHDYPDLAQHEKEHAVFTDHIRRFNDDLEKGREELQIETVELTQFLGEWLANHIKVVDKRYAGYLRERGVT